MKRSRQNGTLQWGDKWLRKDMLRLTGPLWKQYGVDRRNHHSSMFSAAKQKNSFGRNHRSSCCELSSGTKFLRKRSLDQRRINSRQSLLHTSTQKWQTTSYRKDHFQNVNCNNTNIQSQARCHHGQSDQCSHDCKECFIFKTHQTLPLWLESSKSESDNFKRSKPTGFRADTNTKRTKLGRRSSPCFYCNTLVRWNDQCSLWLRASLNFLNSVFFKPARDDWDETEKSKKTSRVLFVYTMMSKGPSRYLSYLARSIVNIYFMG